jgi:DNA-binding transcriptional ArsR family regulator
VTQPALNFDGTPAPRRRIRRNVRQTSIQQYAEGRERFVGRRGDVLRWLSAYYYRVQVWPTAAELTKAENPELAFLEPEFQMEQLNIRRGLSDLQQAGVVEANGARVCRVSGRHVQSWRVVPVGRD